MNIYTKQLKHPNIYICGGRRWIYYPLFLLDILPCDSGNELGKLATFVCKVSVVQHLNTLVHNLIEKT